MSTHPPERPTDVPVCYRHPDRESHIRCQRCQRPICPDCMQEASVGFQCPDCVAAGRRTRTGVSRYGGAISERPQLTSMVLIGINLAVWLVINLTGRTSSTLYQLFGLRAEGACADDTYVYPNASEAVCATRGGTTWLEGVSDGSFWQIVTSGFTHVDVLHVGMNCFFIYLIGPQLEAVVGRARYLAIFFTALLFGSVFVYWLSDPQITTVGASGAAYGLMGALLVVVIKQKLDARQLLILIGINVAFTFAVAGISWQGHLGGFLGGALATTVIVLAPRGPHRARLQWLGIALLLVIAVVLVVARTAVLT